MMKIAEKDREVQHAKIKGNKRYRHRVQYLTAPREWFNPPVIGKNGLSPFEFTVALGVIALGRGVVADQHHVQALKAGDEKIVAEKQAYEKFVEEDWPEVKRERREMKRQRRRRIMGGEELVEDERKVGAPVFVRADGSTTYKPGERDAAINRAGETGYRHKRQALRKKLAPELIMVETTARELLKAAGLPAKGEDFIRLPDALDWLTKAKLPGSQRPLLRSWQRHRDRLQLVVHGLWLARYRPLPPKLPLQNSHALALLLFLQTVDTRALRRAIGQMQFSRLCDLLGIKSLNRQRDLNRAIRSLNSYLERMADRAEELAGFGIKLPRHYEPIMTGHHVRFIARPYPQPAARDHDVDDDGSYVRRQSATRPRIDPERERLDRLYQRQRERDEARQRREAATQQWLQRLAADPEAEQRLYERLC